MGIINFSSSGGRKQIATYNSCVSNIQFTNKPDWISNPIENSGGLYIQVSANSSPSSRTCSDLEITYTSGEYNCSKTITIFQEGVSQQKTNPNLSWSESDKIITLGDQYELPTFNNPYQVTPITFSSNNSSVAQVNGTVGGNPNITINGPGSAVISADFPGNSDYLAQKVSYPLTVKKNSTNISWSQSVYNGTIGEDVSGLLSLDYPEDMNISNNRLYFQSSDNSYASFTNIYDLSTLVIKKSTSIGVKIYAHFTGDNKYSSTSVFCTLKIKDAELIEPVPFIWQNGGNITTFEATVGQTKGLPTLAYPSDLDTSRIYYSTEDGTIAGFTSSNTVRSLVIRAAGTTKIYADFKGDDKYLPCKVSYVLSVSSIELKDPTNFHWNGNNIDIIQGQESTINEGELYFSKQNDMEWSEILFTTDGNTGVARINSNNGKIELLGGVGTVDVIATYVGDKYNSKTVRKTITVRPTEEQGAAESFDTILTKFNNSGIYTTKITKSSNRNLYSYLEAMYNSAKEEYNSNSPLFDISNYQEIVNYHGNNTQYELDGTAENAMYYWLMAMCLSEIFVTSIGQSKDGNHPNIQSSSENENRQSKFFKFAYDLGKESGYGRKINLYGNYTLKGDVNICRLVATVIYSKNRRHYKNTVLSIREELSENDLITPVSVSSDNYHKKWEITLGITGVKADNCSVKHGNGMLKSTVGYAVNLDNIFPAAAGPYATNYAPVTKYINNDPNQGIDTEKSINTDWCNDGIGIIRANYPWEQGQSESIFNLSDHNYQVDKSIYDEVCSKYNLNSSDLTIFRRTVQAIADECEDWAYLLGNKTYYTYNSSNVHDSFVAGTPSSPNYFEGVFNSTVLGQDLSIHSGKTNFTNLLYFTSRACKENRKTTLDPQYGRRRPGQGTSDGSAYSSNYSVYNFLQDATISALAGGQTRYDSSGNQYYIDKNGNQIYDLNSSDPEYIAGSGKTNTTSINGSPLNAHTYPSGHSAGIWGVAMMLIELLPNRYTQIYKAAYDYCISRTIKRAHWNSDTIYGRLAASTIVPILHAFSDFESVYSNAENIISGNIQNGGKGSATLIPNSSGNNVSDSSIDVKVVNKTGNTITLDRKAGFNFVGDDVSIGFIPSNYAENISVANDGELIIVQNYNPKSTDYHRMSPLGGSQTVQFKDTSNVAAYRNQYSQTVSKDYTTYPDLYGQISPYIKDFPANSYFGLGKIYTIYIGGSNASSIQDKSSGVGNTGEGTSTLKITNNGTTNIDLSKYIRFIVSHNGTLTRTDRLEISINNGSNTITLQPGDSCNATFVIDTSETCFGDNFANLGSGTIVNGDTYYSNIILYTSTGNGQVLSPILPSLSTTSAYVNGVYSIDIGGGTNPEPSPNEELFQPITVQFKIHNFSGMSATVTGVRFIVKSQDTNGYFHGLQDSATANYYNCGYGSDCTKYIGGYNRTPTQSITSVTIANGAVSDTISLNHTYTDTLYTAAGITNGNSAVATGTGGLGNRNPYVRGLHYGTMLYSGGNSYHQTIISPNVYNSKAEVLNGNYQFDRFQSGITYHIYILDVLE